MCLCVRVCVYAFTCGYLCMFTCAENRLDRFLDVEKILFSCFGAYNLSKMCFSVHFSLFVIFIQVCGSEQLCISTHVSKSILIYRRFYKTTNAMATVSCSFLFAGSRYFFACVSALDHGRNFSLIVFCYGILTNLYFFVFLLRQIGEKCENSEHKPLVNGKEWRITCRSSSTLPHKIVFLCMTLITFR